MKLRLLTLLILLPMTVDAGNNAVHTAKLVKLHQALEQDNQYYTLLFKFNALGHRLIAQHDNLSQGKTGFKSLDELNEKLGGKPSYEKVRRHLKVAFNAALLAREGKSYHDLLDAYHSAKGEGKYWNLEDPRMQRLSSFVKKIWVELTPKATQALREYRQSHDMPDLTGIKNLDELNSIHRGTIINTFFTGQRANATLVVEFEQAVQGHVVDEYRSVHEVAKIEND